MTAIFTSPSGLPPGCPARSLCAATSFERWSAHDRLAGPAPTSRTSISSISLSTAIRLREFRISNFELLGVSSQAAIREIRNSKFAIRNSSSFALDLLDLRRKRRHDLEE